MERIRIDQVVTDRDLDAAEPLPSDPNIVRVPIVVSREDMVLIDGLRRLKYWRDSGVKTISAILVSNVDEAYDALAPQHAGRKLTPPQMWNILRIVHPWGIKESHASRIARSRETRLSGRPPAPTSRHNVLRMRMVSMLNAPSGHGLERTMYLYRAAEAGNKLAIDMVREVEQGQRSVYSACDVVAQGEVFRGSVREVSEQKTLLENGSRNLGAHVGALLKLGSPVLVSDEDLETYIQALVVSRSKLATFINQLKNVQRERTHG